MEWSAMDHYREGTSLEINCSPPLLFPKFVQIVQKRDKIGLSLGMLFVTNFHTFRKPCPDVSGRA